MTDIKWIKITTDVFNDEKIRLIETLPESDTLIIIWFKLLAMAGKCNDSGLIYLARDIPYNDEMLSTILRRPINVIRLALNQFKKLNMIEIENDFIAIINWEKHQNIDKLDKMKEQSRISSSKYREKQKKLLNSGDMIVTSRDATEKNRIDKSRIDKNKEPNPRAIESAQLLYDLLQINLSPTSWEKNPPNLETWSSDIEKINRLDGIDYIIINSVIRWVAQDTFWNKNVMSGAKLRKQFTRLEVESKGKRPETSEERKLRYKKREEEIENIKNNSDNIFN